MSNAIDRMPDVSIIVVNWNTRELLTQCLDSRRLISRALELETIVLDNASTDGSQRLVRECYSDVKLIANETNAGFARAVNQAVKASEGRYTLVLNSDVRLMPNSVELMVELADRTPEAGIVGAQLVNPDGTFQASYASFPTLSKEFLILSGLGRLFYGSWYPSPAPKTDLCPECVDYVAGACMLIRRQAFERVGGMDPDYFMYSEEVDLCYAMWKNGWQVWHQPLATVVHLGGGSSQHRKVEREADLYQGRVRFFRKHYGRTAALLLKLQIFEFTMVKGVVHGLLFRITGGGYGRKVVPLRYLFKKLKDL